MAFTPITKNSQPSPQPIYCTNCGTMIGRLETPHLWGEHIVCAACYQRLAVPAQAVESPTIAQEPPIVFRANGVTVTTDGIRGPDAAIAMSQILSVKSRRPFWPGGIVVDVYDLVERPHSFFFKSKTTASHFIAAIRSVNGSVNIDRESTGWFIIWG